MPVDAGSYLFSSFLIQLSIRYGDVESRQHARRQAAESLALFCNRGYRGSEQRTQAGFCGLHRPTGRVQLAEYVKATECWQAKLATHFVLPVSGSSPVRARLYAGRAGGRRVPSGSLAPLRAG
eukprot:4075618-Pleurochrysis_carterae.AAC.1